MARPQRAVKRLQFDLTEKDLERLEWLRGETDAMSVAEVIRRSLGVYEEIVKLQNGDAKLVVRYKIGEEENLRFK